MCVGLEGTTGVQGYPRGRRPRPPPRPRPRPVRAARPALTLTVEVAIPAREGSNNNVQALRGRLDWSR
jgi:hypothetical protein